MPILTITRDEETFVHDQTPRSGDHLRLRIYVVAIVMDMAALLGAFACANLIVIGTLWGQPGKPHGLVMFMMIAPIYALLAINSGVYGLDVANDRRSAAWRALWSFGQAIMLTLLIIFLAKMADQLSRLTFIAGVILSIGGLVAVRWIGGHYAMRSLNPLVAATVMLIDDVDPPLTGDLCLRVDIARAGLNPSDHDAVMAARLAEVVGTADRVVVACSSERMAHWTVALRSLSAKVEILLPELMQFAPATLGDFAQRPTLVMSSGPMRFRDRIIKRLFDLLLAGVAVLLLSPVLIMVAIAIKLSDRGPCLFTQQRLGKDSRPFAIYKFRTMYHAMADDQADQLTQRGDARITRIGGFLRRTSLDELPQIFNVLKGDMSIVGPRPHAAAAKAADKLYWEVDDRYWTRHSIKPGMTGLAQIRGFRGATDEHADLVNRLQADLEYVTHWSVLRDVGIIAATLRVLVHPNAY